MNIRRLIGFILLLIAAGMVLFPVLGGFGMTGIHSGIVILAAMSGVWMTCG